VKDGFLEAVSMNRSREDSVLIGKGYRLENRGIGFQFQARKTGFYSPQGPNRIRRSLGLLSMSKRLFPLVKLPGRKADDSLPSSFEVKNACSYTSSLQHVFMEWCLFKHRNNFTFISGGCT
jgi:hypothetical protein